MHEETLPDSILRFFIRQSKIQNCGESSLSHSHSPSAGLRHKRSSQEKIFRIGFLDSGTASGSAALVDAFRQELSKLGWIEAKNVTIEYRFAEQRSERVAEFAAELVRLNVDLIVASGGVTPTAAKGTTTTIPIVMTNSADPVGEGVVASLARPGGNITGNASLSPELNTKRLEVLRTRFPGSTELDFCGCRETS